MGKLTQTTAEVQSLLNKVEAGADAQLSFTSTNAVQNQAVSNALDRKVTASKTTSAVYAVADGFIREDVKYRLPGVEGQEDNNTIVTLELLDYAIITAITNALNTAI